jgi:16S rRNA (cytosine967-C5)-methyltransferase
MPLVAVWGPYAAILTSKWRQTPEGVAELNQKQISILNSAARLLKPGGRLVYATCSLLPQENQGVAEDFLKNHPEFEVVPAAEVLKPLFPKEKLPLGCSADYPWWQLWPHIHGTDGFFGAVFQKKNPKSENAENHKS